MNNLPRGLYVITDDRFGDVVQQVAQALAGGAVMVQYRDKSNDSDKRRDEAKALRALCRDHGTPLLINDDIELAMTIGADGVHLGRDDPPLAMARAMLGPRAIVGVSCYNRFELAEQAGAAGASYVAFGRFFGSGTKPDAVQAEPALLTRAATELGVPAVAIGGITPDNGGPLVAAGAQLLAVIEAVVGQPDVAAAARRFAPLFASGESSR